MGKRPEIKPMAVTRAEAARALSLHINTLDRRIKSGEIRVKKTGGRVLVPVSEIERYLSPENEKGPPSLGGPGNVTPIKPRAAEPSAEDRSNSPSRA